MPMKNSKVISQN